MNNINDHRLRNITIRLLFKYLPDLYDNST